MHSILQTHFNLLQSKDTITLLIIYDLSGNTKYSRYRRPLLELDQKYLTNTALSERLLYFCNYTMIYFVIYLLKYFEF